MSVSKNYMYNVLLIISNTIFPIITFPYVSRVLMPEYLGKVYFVQGVIAYFLLFSAFGTPSYGIKELSKAKGVGDWEEFKKIFTELFVISITTSFISFLSVLFITNLYDKFREEKLIFYIFALQVLFECFHINYFFVVMENHKRRLIRSISIRIISLFFLFYFIKSSEDYYLYALLIVAPEVIARIIDVISMRKYITLKGLNFKRHLKNMSLIFMYLFTIGIYGSLDTTMLGIMVGDTEVGLYAAAIKMYKMTLPVILTLGIVLSPRIIKEIKLKNKINLYKNFDTFIDYCFLVGIPGTILMIFLAKEFTLLFSGKTFEGAIVTMKILSPCLTFVALGSFIGAQILLPNNMEKNILYISICGVILNISLNYFFIPLYLRNGAALSLFITELVMALIKVYLFKKLYSDYKIINRSRMEFLLISFISLFITLFIFKYITISNMLLKLIFIPIIFGFFYFIILFFIKNKVIIEWINFAKIKIKNS